MAGALSGALAVWALTAAVASPPEGGTSPSAQKDGAKSSATSFLSQLKTNKEKTSYAWGQRFGQQILRDWGRSDVVDTDLFLKGLKAGLAGESGMDLTAMQTLVVDYRTEIVKEDAARFLEENKKKEGVKTTPSGVQYVVLKSGDPNGKKAALNATVKVHYTGTLVNGTKFDSSLDKGEPIEFELKTGPGGVVAGWVEGLQQMHVGDKWRLFIPPELGYGSRGKGPVPPNAVMIFEVELLDVK